MSERGQFQHNPCRHVYPLGTLPTMKDVGLRIRIDRELRERFLAVCRDEDKPAAQVIREFMRHYVEQQELNPAEKPTLGKQQQKRG